MVPGVLIGLALATPPGGLRIDSGLPEVEVRLRDAWALRPGPAGAHQLLADVQLPLPGRWPVLVEAELPVIHHWDPGQGALGTGQLRLAGRLWGEARQGERRVVVNSWGVELGLPTRRAVPEGAWVLHAAESVPAVEGLYVVEMSVHPKDDSWVHLRGGLGLVVRQDGEDLRLWPPAPMLDLAVAWVKPLGTSPLALGTSLELIADRVPVATRHWLRTDYGRGVAFDVGVQLPWVQLVRQQPELVLVGQLSWRRPEA